MSGGVRRWTGRFLALLLAGMAAGTAPADEHVRQMRVGQVETFILEGIPGTGMSWRLDATASTSPERVAVEAMGYGAPSSPRIGGPAPFSFTLTAQSTGLARLVFVYGRAWEAAVAETEVLYVCVIEPAPDTCAEPAAP